MPIGLLGRLAQRLAKARPLQPYPGWYFGIDETRPRWVIRLRLALWHVFRDHGIQYPITMRFREGFRFRVFLGNDLSRCLFVGGCIEPNELCLFNSLLAPGMIVVDAGANEGLYTVLAAHRVGPSGLVLAVEPSLREIPRLRANLALNAFQHVRVIEAALSDQTGTGVLHLANDEHAGQNTLGRFIYEGTAAGTTQPVALTTLDCLAAREALPRVDLVKIDVEGAEMKVLRGGEITLRRHRPPLFLELSDAALQQQGASAADVLTWLGRLGYLVLTYDPATGLPEEASTSSSLTTNIVAWPKDRVLPRFVPARPRPAPRSHPR
jgi:FkbM family methyltransferase